MRPKLLEIDGLQSFTDTQKIDFEALSETGLFGIFGPTGSGKSTILDAITFALYGRVKRAEGGTQGIINLNRNTARVSFSFELLKNGSRRNYRVERTYQRKKNSPNACEPKIARLIEVTEEGEIPLCDKATEVSNYIKDLLGLSNDDFTRAVVLPQNSFQDFLMLNNKDRRGMLERIFYLEEYGKQLWDKLGRKMSAIKSRLDVLSGELKGYADASDSAIEEARKAMKAAAAERTRVEEELKLLEIKYNEAKEVWAFVKELEDINKKKEQHLSVRAEIDDKRLKLEKALKADGLIKMILKNKELNEKLSEAEKQLSEIQKVLPGVSDKMTAVRARYIEIKNEAASEQPKLVSQRVRLVDALEIRREITVISQKIGKLQHSIAQLQMLVNEKNELIKSETLEFDQLVKKYESLKREIEPLKTDPEYRQHMQEGAKQENEVFALAENAKEHRSRETAMMNSSIMLEERLSVIRKAIEASQNSQKELLDEMQKHEASKPGDRNVVLKSIEKINSVQGLYEVLKLRKNELEQLNVKLELQQTNLNKALVKSKALNEAKENAGKTCERFRLELDKAISEIDRSDAYNISKNLKDGEPCPVCGSITHPRPAVHGEEPGKAILESYVNIAREKLADAEKIFKTTEIEAYAANEQIKTMSENKTHLMQELEQKKAEYETERLRLPEKLTSLKLEQIVEEIEKANTTYSQKLKAIDIWEEKLSEFKDSLQKLNDEMNEHRIIENSAVTEWKVNGENLKQHSKKLKEIEIMLNEAHKRYHEFLNKYNITGAGSELKRLTENDRKMKLLQMDMDKSQDASEIKRTHIDKLKEELRQLNAEDIKQQADFISLCGQKNDKEAKMNELVGGADIEGEITHIDKKLEEYTKLDKELQQQLQVLETQHNELQIRKSTFENQQRIYSESVRNEDIHLKAAIAEKGFEDTCEVENSILNEDMQKEYKAEVEAFDQQFTNINVQMELVKIKLNARTISEEEWNAINTAYTGLIAYKEDCVSGSEIARSSYDTLMKKNEKWKELCRIFSESRHKEELLEQIQKVLKAEHRKDNSFIDYIAEERLRYVAARASETLGLMTKYRYALELDVEAGFIIRDNANGGVHRMVTTLSGGETFLTSLALALALSEQIQLKGQSPLEFFFLDEGFGTLDAELLDTVIDSLERLSSKERVIGLISHVPELKSRIGRRLIVEPPAFQNEGSKVAIEKA